MKNTFSYSSFYNEYIIIINNFILEGYMKNKKLHRWIFQFIIITITLQAVKYYTNNFWLNLLITLVINIGIQLYMGFIFELKSN